MSHRTRGVAAGLAAPDAPTHASLDPDAEGVSGGVSLLAHALAGVVGQLGARLEAFAVGPVAQHIGE